MKIPELLQAFELPRHTSVGQVRSAYRQLALKLEPTYVTAQSNRAAPTGAWGSSTGRLTCKKRPLKMGLPPSSAPGFYC
jgi:hypothetical protein